MAAQDEAVLQSTAAGKAADARALTANRRLATRRRLGKALVPYLFLSPFLIAFLVFNIFPLIYALGLSLFRDTLIGGRRFVGAENYLRVFSDGKFWEGVGNMILFGLVQMPIMLGLALLLALVLDSGLARLRGFFRIGFYLPYAVPTVIAALIWGYLYGPAFGPFTQAADLLNLPAPTFLSRSWMLFSIANILTWEYTGYNMIILFAALQAVPRELEEAAVIDGASTWKFAWYVKIPLIRPAIILTIIFSIIGTFQLFNEPQLMRALAPQVIGTNYTPNIYAYSLAFTNLEYNYSAAVSFVLGGVVAVFSYVFMFATRRKGRVL